jgi:hypothetical protein
MAKGYSSLFVQSVKDANPYLLGVRLAKLCIKKDIPVVDVAQHFNVSRMSVYAWFRGVRDVSDKHADKMKKLIDKLS